MGERVTERLGDAGRWGEPVRLSNPVNKKLPLMRTSVIPALLDVVRRNSNVGEKDLRFFELGKVFRKTAGGYEEGWVLAGVLAGDAERVRWDAESRQIDFFDGKGILQALMEALDIDTPRACCYDGPLFEWGSVLSAGERSLGVYGMLSGEILSAWELDGPVFAFEVDLDLLVELLPEYRSYSEPPRFPRVRRDVALVLDENVAAGEVIDAVEESGEPLLTDVHVFDVYRGEQLGKNKKSLALSLTYMSSERTLTDSEVDGPHGRIVERLRETFGATLR
jgi:phenylalanyl-tRNA synthetase beta chain